MDTLTVSIAEGKKNFTKLIRASEEQNQNIIVSRRGNPVAVIVPYEAHMKNTKKEALMKIEDVRVQYHQAGLRAQTMYEISKKVAPVSTTLVGDQASGIGPTHVLGQGV